MKYNNLKTPDKTQAAIVKQIRANKAQPIITIFVTNGSFYI